MIVAAMARLGWIRTRALIARTLVAGACLGASVAPAAAEVGAYIVFDAKTGEVFARHNADQAWYPASVTKLMTAYVTFQAIKSGKLKFTSPVIMSAAANAQPPSKMGFPVGTVITVDNALKMIMVKSANDVAWALGEAVGGSKAEFVALMNAYAARLGMTETNWGNPNGLPDASQVTTARDLGLLARALLREFPEYDFYYRLPGIQLGNRIIRNHNHLIDHYPGTDGMKTGFICASGFNVVASATREGRRVIAVVLGASGTRPRAERAADLFNRAFESSSTGMNLFGLGSTKETLDAWKPGPEASLPVQDLRKEICGGKHKEAAQEELSSDDTSASANDNRSGAVILGGQLNPAQKARGPLLAARFDIGPPVKVWIGGADSIVSRTAVATNPAPVPATPATDQLPPPALALQPTQTPARAPGAIIALKPAGAKPKPAGPAAPQPAPPATDENQSIDRAFSAFPPDAQQPPSSGPIVLGTEEKARPTKPGAVRTDESKTADALPVPRSRPEKAAAKSDKPSDSKPGKADDRKKPTAASKSKPKSKKPVPEPDK